MKHKIAANLIVIISFLVFSTHVLSWDQDIIHKDISEYSAKSSVYGFATIRKDGPYEGKIIDGDTGKPIEGVVVLGVWYKEHPGPGGAVSEYYDAMETVTDKNGEFKIEGLGLLVMSNVVPMDVVIFKAGYTYYGLMTWKELKSLFKTEGDKVIVRLRKLTIEERKKRLIGKESIPDNKQKILIRELNQEKKELGKSLYQEVE